MKGKASRNESADCAASLKLLESEKLVLFSFIFHAPIYTLHRHNNKRENVACHGTFWMMMNLISQPSASMKCLRFSRASHNSFHTCLLFWRRQRLVSGFHYIALARSKKLQSFMLKRFNCCPPPLNEHHSETLMNIENLFD